MDVGSRRRDQASREVDAFGVEIRNRSFPGFSGIEGMMSYYRYQPDANNYAGIGVSSADVERLCVIHFADSSLASGWSPLICYGLDENPEQEGDFPSLSNYWRIPVVSERAWDCLKPILGSTCEALPIVHPSGNSYFLVHVMRAVDCLDVENSIVRRYTDGGIMRVVQYSFNSNVTKDLHAFKLPKASAGELLVDDTFRRTVETNGLKGLVFKAIPMVNS